MCWVVCCVYLASAAVIGYNVKTLQKKRANSATISHEAWEGVCCLLIALEAMGGAVIPSIWGVVAVIVAWIATAIMRERVRKTF